MNLKCKDTEGKTKGQATTNGEQANKPMSLVVGQAQASFGQGNAPGGRRRRVGSGVLSAPRCALCTSAHDL